MTEQGSNFKKRNKKRKISGMMELGSDSDDETQSPRKPIHHSDGDADGESSENGKDVGRKDTEASLRIIQQENYTSQNMPHVLTNIMIKNFKPSFFKL